MSNPTGRVSYNIEELRKRMKERASSRSQDPHEFVPPKAKGDQVIKFKFFILPDLNEEDLCFGGKATRGMDGMFFLKDGVHWVNKRPHACPRILSEEECEMCNIGFELMGEEESKDAKRAIAKQWLSQTNYKVNIFFPAMEPNPVIYHGKTMWFNGPKTCFDQWYGAFHRNDGGTEDDPEAHGVFYDPYEAFAYSLVIKNQGDYNDYKSSKFLANLGKVPILCLPGTKTADEAGIQKILNLRHDLFTKIDVPNPKKITELAQTMLHGEAGGGSTTGGGGEIQPTTPADMGEEMPAKPKAAAPAAKPAARPAPAPAAKPAAPKPAPKPAPAPTVAEEEPPTEEPVIEEGAEGAEVEVAEVEVEPAPVAKPVAKPAPAKAAVPAAKPATVPAAKPAAAPVAKTPAPAAKPAAKSAAPTNLGGEDDDDEVQRLIARMKGGVDE